MSAATEYYGYLLAQGYGENQLNEFVDYAQRANRGEISHNQAYRLAKKAGFSNMTYEEAQDSCEAVYESQGAEAFNKCVSDAREEKKGFKDWLQTAQDAGWIDKGLGLVGNLINKPNQDTGSGAGYYQPAPQKSNMPIILLGSLAVIGIGVAIYFGTRKK